MRSSDLWFRPIETRVGPDGALYVVDFYNQAVIHNDTRGPLHGPANAAVRPDRDHYFGRIWRVQHKQATKLDVPVLESRGSRRADSRRCETSPNAHVKADRVAAGAGELRVGPAARADQEADGQQGLALYERARARDDRRAAQGGARPFAAATDNWTRSAFVAAATEQAPAYVAERVRATTVRRR